MAAKYGYIGNNPADSSVFVARQAFSPSGITTTFTFASGYTIGYLDAYLNGSRLIEGQDYVATNGSTVDLVSAATGGDTLELLAYKAFNTVALTDAPGDFEVGTNLTVGGYISAGGSITGATFYGDGSNLAGVSASKWITTAAGIHTLSNVGIGTTNPRFKLEVGAVGASGTTLFVNGDARVTGIVTIGPASITLNGITNIINVGTAVTINSSGINVVGVITATSFVGDGTNITGVSGFSTALSSTQGSLLNTVFKTSKSFTVGAGTSANIESDVGSGNIAFTRLGSIVVSTGATVRVATGTTFIMNVLNIF